MVVRRLIVLQEVSLMMVITRMMRMMVLVTEMFSLMVMSMIVVRVQCLFDNVMAP